MLTLHNLFHITSFSWDFKFSGTYFRIMCSIVFITNKVNLLKAEVEISNLTILGIYLNLVTSSQMC